MASSDPLEPIGASFLDDPYPLYRQLRDDHPVYRHATSSGDLWILSRYDDVSAALTNWQSYSSVPPPTRKASIFARRAPHGGRQLIETDPPLHDALRETMNPRFSPRRIRELESAFSTAASDLLDGVGSRDRLDVAGEFAWPLTMRVTSDLIGIPDEDREDVLGWYLDVVYSGSREVAAASADRYREYFEALASARVAAPADDVLSELMQLTGRGLIAQEDAVLLAMDLFEGGVDVPANLIANSVVALAERPEAHAWLADPDLDRSALRIAIEELARFDTPIQHLPRTAATDIDVHGVTIPRGSHVRLLLGSANHDERRYQEPDRLDLTRPPIRSVAFGVGVHFCIGAPLARLGVGIALPMLLRAIPSYSILGPVERPHGADNMRALLNLDLRLLTGPHDETAFRVVVDVDRCQSHGQCVLAAPSVFSLDDDLNLHHDSAPLPALRADVERAVQLCPTQAIRIEAPPTA